MDEKKCKQIALFRYGIISDFINQVSFPHGKKEALLKYKCECAWKIPYSVRTQISRSIIFYWIKKYNQGGKIIEALYPNVRNDRKKSRVISSETAKNLTWMVKNKSINTVQTLIKQIKLQNQKSLNSKLTVSTIYRFLHQNDLMKYIEKNKESYKKPVKDTNLDKMWMQKLSYGKLSINALKNDLCSKVPNDDLEKLYYCVINEIRFRKRAICILALNKGISQQTIIEFLFSSRTTVSYNRKKYHDRGVDCIISDIRHRSHEYENLEYIDTFFSILHSPPSEYGFNRTTWRQKDLLKTMSSCNMPISRNSLTKIIKNSGYKYRKAKKRLTSNDPKYKEKIQKITNILSNLGEKEKFFSIDEYGPFAIKMQEGVSLVAPGTVKTVPQWQKNKGSLIITATVELATNQIIHFYSKKKNTGEMIKLLYLLIGKYSDQKCIYFSWDAASWHASKALYKKVDVINSKKFKRKIKSPIVKLAPLPTCAQFLNVIESIFSGMEC
jgi:transposase